MTEREAGPFPRTYEIPAKDARRLFRGELRGCELPGPPTGDVLTGISHRLDKTINNTSAIVLLRCAGASLPL